MPTAIVTLPAAVLAAMTSVAGQGVLLAGRYRLGEPLASGGAGQVWRAVDLVLERPVAVKLLRPEAAVEPEARARLRAEARNASRLCHPGVAQVYDYGESSSPDVPFLVMELVDGPSLAEVLAGGPLDPGQTMDLIAQVCAGLHAAHSAGLVHRDIKPANLLITADGQVKITDFGIAHVVEGVPLTATGVLIGTPAYLAPERAAGGPATPASDLYSLGVVGYECLTGAPPFRGRALEVAEAHLRCPLPALPVTVPAEVGALVVALTAKDPSNRPASAREVAERAGQLRAAGKITLSGATSPITASGGWGAALPLTLTDISAQATQASLPVLGGRQARRRRGPAWKKAGAGLAMVAALTAAGLAGWQAGLAGAARPHSAATPRQPSPPSVPVVLVSSASLVGQPAGVVLADLRRLGLRPELSWVPTSARPPGTVLSVQPDGTLPPETIVTVTVAAPPAQQGDQTGSGDGNGGHDGGRDGGGNNS
jgi:eukaryotic-like serine/threonine-protein kinase